MDKRLNNLSIVASLESLNATTTIDTTEPYEYNGSGFNDSDYYCSNFEGNITYLNISCETQLSYSLPLYGYITPFLILITIIANSLIVIVLSRRNMSSPTNSVLLAMALCDVFTILFPGPGIIYMFTFGQHSKPLGPEIMCYLYTFFNETFPSMFHTASIWLTVALALQRYIYVCHAPLARTYLTMPRVRRSILFICIAAVFHQSTRFFDTKFVPMEIMWEGKKVMVCSSEIAPWIKEYIGENTYFTSYYLFRVAFVHLIPCFLLVVLNIFLFRAMKQAQKKRQKLFDKCCKKSKRSNDKNCTTLMLIVILTVFLVVEIPLAIITALHVISTLFVSFLDYRIANLCILILNFFLILSYPINFAIYCGMSRQFRETFKALFWRRSMAANGNNVTTIMGSRKHEQSSRYSLVNGPKSCTNETVL
ncbi:unnamed protein product [Diamesa tonsa]